MEEEGKSFAMEMLGDYKKQNKRLFIALIIVLCMWLATIVYLVYLLNDIGTETITEETTTQEITDVDEVCGNIINRGSIWEKSDKPTKEE